MFRLVLTIGICATATGCDWTVFDKVEDDTWVISRGSPGGLGAEDIGQGLAFAGSGGSGLDIIAVGEAPPGLASMSFERDGATGANPLEIRTDSAIEFAERFATPPEISADVDSYNGETGNLAISAKQGTESYLLLIKASSMSVTDTILLPQGTLATGLAFGETDQGDGTDLAIVVGPTLAMLEDYQASQDLTDCALDSGGRDIAIADVNPAAGAELIVGLGTRVAVFSGSAISNDACSDEDALEIIPAPDAADDFGDEIVVGDFNGNGNIDVAISAHDQNKVHVYLDWSGGAPSPSTVSGPSGSSLFGVALAAGDLSGGGDELIVGDPQRDAGGKGAAGSVFVYENGDFGSPVWTAHDATPERSQRFGKSVAVGYFDDSDPVVVVGAKDEIFTYFRTPLYSDVRD